MSRSVSRRGRMQPEDQFRMQKNATFIEEEVDGKDLVTTLYEWQTIDYDDKEEVTTKLTQRERIRRLVDILRFRGPKAFDDFLRCLDCNGYEYVAHRLRNTSPREICRRRSTTPGEIRNSERNLTRENSLLKIVNDQINVMYEEEDENNNNIIKDTDNDKAFITSADCVDFAMALGCTGSSSDFHCQDDSCSSDEDSEGRPMPERVKAIEDSLYILGRRITRAENRAQASAKLPEEELHILKVELTLLKTDTLQQISDLTVENEKKDALIQHLTQEVEDKKSKLERAHSKIGLLERRLATLETDKKRAEADLRLVKQRLDDNERQMEEQNNHYNAESLRMRNQILQQQKRSKDQEAALVELQKRDMERAQNFMQQQEQIFATQDDLKEQQLNMAEQHQKINALASVIQNITQSGISAPGNGPMMCVSGNSVNSFNEKASNVRPSGKRWTGTAHHKCSKRK